METFFYWSGVAAWAALAFLGALALIDRVIDWVVEGFKVKREFLAFVWDRLKRKQSSFTATDTTGASK